MKLIERKKELRKKIKSAKTVFIMAHKDLDLDALGSSIGLYIILEKLYKNCFLIINDTKHESGVSKVFKELEGCLNIIKDNEIEDNLYIRSKKNLLIILDTNKEELVQASDAINYFDKENIIILDHHELGETSIDAGLRIIDNDISSTCEMITNLIETYKMELDPYYATLLLSGIVLDTNNFTLKTNSETYYAAYYLASMGASTKKVQYLLKQDLKEYIERQKLITNVDIIDSTIAIAKGSPYMIYRREDIAKIADTLLFFNDIEASFVIAKTTSKTISVSGRSLGNYDISKILTPLGGGGNKTVGAARISDSTISKVETKLKQILKKEEE